MTFVAGESGNPNGRPKGARNRRTQEVIDQIEATGKDPLVALSEIITTNKDPNIVATASQMLAPYLHSKRSTAPVSRYVEIKIEVPNFTTVQQAEEYLASLPGLLGRGEIDSQTALELSTLTRNWLSAIYERQELDLKIAGQGGGPSEQVIRVENSPGLLPGTNIVGFDGSGPIVNGRTVVFNGHSGPVIDHQPPATESVQQEPKAGEP